ncbi:hypothetical protein PHLGIDRAFT_116935 [Phlebiopsis gigantea 11061_1 CR5-6]|uniref:Uncharacterized protein n=1 Tax=Phlebiopsis gigantea (strain 11061_1 CR5-6) TaxID=745531 RepID=A0A0C3NU47_PHLG1|nr:hypothetical protein PHLGIDRAFT_116935 [Phlebiopsis gigantea 11061_1 CR5-6]
MTALKLPSDRDSISGRQQTATQIQIASLPITPRNDDRPLSDAPRTSARTRFCGRTRRRTHALSTRISLHRVPRYDGDGDDAEKPHALTIGDPCRASTSHSRAHTGMTHARACISGGHAAGYHAPPRSCRVADRGAWGSEIGPGRGQKDVGVGASQKQRTRIADVAK